MNERDKRICKDCGTEIFANVNMVMLRDDLWKSICDDVNDDLCDKCIEKKLKRGIMPSDFMRPTIQGVEIIPCNAMWIENKLKNNGIVIKNNP